MPRYNPKIIEPKWQRFWDDDKTFRTADHSDKPKYYILDMFPYPSGAGLHVGHPEGYTATDILARYRRMCGWNVLHPMGWDAFGLPAEEHARQTGQHPCAQTQESIDTFRRQIKMLGFSYDWDREVDTTNPKYFKWTQWIFLQLFDTWYDDEQQRGRPISDLPIPPDVRQQGERAVRLFQDSKRLAYQVEAPVNWCPALGTVLANEEVIDGKSERGAHPVGRILLRQWMLRITSYAERLLNDIASVNWPEPIKEMQRNWIGRSEGAEVSFKIAGVPLHGRPDDTIRVFTTRPDTLFGATYMVLAPEHPLVDDITTSEYRPAITEYKAEAVRKSDLERTELAKRKTGAFTGAYAINPVNGEKIPIWIADYVLISYGTGAIMAVPAHDERDLAFAQQFRLPIRTVVRPPDEWLVETKSDVEELRSAYTGNGIALNSGQFDGLATPEFKQRIIAWLEGQGVGQRKINYKLRDWLFSRQRYWGEPFPLLHEVDEKGEPTGIIEALTVEELPLELPELKDYKPTGKPEPPLEKATDWIWVTRHGKRYKRETNTMPQWAGSCWYYLRYIDPRNDKAFCDPAKEKHWMPVDLYVGGAEHAVLHLLYARFWHKVLYDRGHVSSPEPFQQLVNQGMILGEVEFTGFKKADGTWTNPPTSRAITDDEYETTQVADLIRVKLSPTEVQKHGDVTVLKTDHSVKVMARAYKMSKSRGNVVNPDRVVEDYGADSLRLYEMFMGPLQATKPWSMAGVNGVRGFLDRAWRMIVNERSDEMQPNSAVQEIEPTDEQNRMLHKTVKVVTEDLDNMAFNTAISRLMEFTNYFSKCDVRPKSFMETFVLLLSPFAPHISEELWNVLGQSESLAYAGWPRYNETMLAQETVEVPVQVRGKVRARISVRPDLRIEELEAIARADQRIASILSGKEITNVIVIPGRLVNFVTK